MTSYRRIKRPGRTYFFTVALAARGSNNLVAHVDALRRAYAVTRAERPFRCDAFVVLPDHLHAMWTMPQDDWDYSTRWRLLKTRFTRSVLATMGAEHPPYLSASKRRKVERGIWQRRFWEHCIRDERDFETHLEYCWQNPVRHGLVARAAEWPYSSIHRDIRRGRADPELTHLQVEGEFGEPK
ncbi:REP-associated tyrosine transposase [Litoreibacter ponti]|nr:transposase [Litoreibacter ponti]